MSMGLNKKFVSPALRAIGRGKARDNTGPQTQALPLALCLLAKGR